MKDKFQRAEEVKSRKAYLRASSRETGGVPEVGCLQCPFSRVVFTDKSQCPYNIGQRINQPIGLQV